jgi:hypothetical protein
MTSKLPDPKPQDYERGNGAVFREFNSRGYLSLKVLPFLDGCAWDEIALGFIHSLRPSFVRVIRNGCTHMDSWCWRVTVYLDSAGLIESVSQEVEVGLPDGVNGGGAALRRALADKRGNGLSAYLD